MTADPGFMAGLALRGFVVFTALLLAWLLAIVIVGTHCPVAYGLIMGMYSHGLGGASGGLRPLAGVAFEAFGILVPMGIAFQTGRWIARQAPGRELPAVLATIMLLWAVPLITACLAFASGHRNWLSGLTSVSLVSDIPWVAGAIWERRRDVNA
jgi:hypothetical protein